MGEIECESDSCPTSVQTSKDGGGGGEGGQVSSPIRQLPCDILHCIAFYYCIALSGHSQLRRQNALYCVLHLRCIVFRLTCNAVLCFLRTYKQMILMAQSDSHLLSGRFPKICKVRYV